MSTAMDTAPDRNTKLRRNLRLLLTVVLVILALFLLCVPGRTGLTDDTSPPTTTKNE